VICDYQTMGSFTHPENKRQSTLYVSLNNGPLLKGSITVNCNVGGSSSWFQYIVPCLSQCAYVPGTLSEPSCFLHNDPSVSPNTLKISP